MKFLVLVPVVASIAALSATVSAQNTTFTSSVPRTTTFTSRGNVGTSTLFVPTTVTSSLSTTSTTSTSTQSPSPTESPQVRLDTKLDPGFGVLGALLILTGLPCAFLGHKNRWSSYFLTGFYSLSLVCLALIIKFGILPAVNPPNKTLRGLFVLSCVVAGIGGGAVSILFWGQAKYFVGGLGGFALAMWIQSFHNGGFIHAIGFRWIFYIGLAVVGFVLCTIPRIHYHVLLASTAFVGATAFMLGVDCYTLAGLKEFYVYNLGFVSLFPKFENIGFPVTQTMQIEIGLIAAAALAGTAIQFRILAVLQIKLRQIKLEQKRRNEEVEARAAERFEQVQMDLDHWEKEHGHGRDASRQGLLRKGSSDSVPDAFSNESTLGKIQGMSELMSPNSDISPDGRQSTGPLPLLNLGDDLVHGISTDSKTDDKEKKDPVSEEKTPSNGRASWLMDFDDIRKSIDWLKSDTPSPTDDARSRKLSYLSRPRTASHGTAEALAGPSSPPVNQARPRVQSMNILSDTPQQPVERERATSTPLRDEEWDAYVKERKLFTPPSGSTEPIPTSERPRSALGLVPIPESVRQAVEGRRKRESLFEMGVMEQNDPVKEDVESPYPLSGSPSVPSRAHHRSRSYGNMPVEILPPRREVKVEERIQATRSRTFEELAERHKRKMSEFQKPLTEAEREQARLDEAKARWEKSHRVEKQEFERRHAENSKKRVSQIGGGVGGGKADAENRRSRLLGNRSSERQSQGLTSEQLAGITNAGGRRSSTAKVLQWQHHQQTEMASDAARATSPPSGHRRQSTHLRDDETIPFPQGARTRRK